MQSTGSVIGRTVVPLLATAAFINYVDRSNLATAAPLIKDQLGLSSTEVGLLLSAFFWSYVPAQLLAGWLAERINAYRTLALGVGLWSIATAASGLASGFVMLMALRILLGFMMARIGWRSVFLLFGLASLLWLIPMRSTSSSRGCRSTSSRREACP